MATISGTDADETLVGSNKADVIDGGAGDDIINSGNGDDVVAGGEGDDQLHGGAGDDELDGGTGADQLVGGAGDDILTGGAGEDFLNGGGGSDTFRFYFGVSEGSGQTVAFPGFGSSTSVTQGTFSSTVSGWLDDLVDAGAGEDLNNDGVIDTAVNANNSGSGVDTSPPTIEGFDGFSDPQTITVTQGPNARDESYWGSATIDGGEPAITAADGNDTLAQFHDAGPNQDSIEMYGITRDQAAALFEYSIGDYDGDGVANDSRISWQGATDDADGSITIIGTTWANKDAFLDIVDFIV